MNIKSSILEDQIKREFKALPHEISLYFQEEMLNPEEVICNKPLKKSIAEIVDRIDKAERLIAERYANNNLRLVQSEGYLLLVSQYFLEKANPTVEQTLRTHGEDSQ